MKGKTMSTSEQLEAEAAELYPDDRDPDDPWGYERKRKAHVRAKTVTAEQLYAAARVMHNMTVDTPWGECSSEVQADLRVQRAAFRAAGFYVEATQ